MLGAIAGDVIGSRFEHAGIKSKRFELFNRQCAFTDDTVHTVALADSILNQVPLRDKLREYYCYYPEVGYGARFISWARSADPTPYNSYGNGSAMRVSPVAWLYHSIEEVLAEARKSAAVTHNHADGVRGAQAVAVDAHTRGRFVVFDEGDLAGDVQAEVKFVATLQHIAESIVEVRIQVGEESITAKSRAQVVGKTSAKAHISVQSVERQQIQRVPIEADVTAVSRSEIELPADTRLQLDRLSDRLHDTRCKREELAGSDLPRIAVDVFDLGQFVTAKVRTEKQNGIRGLNRATLQKRDYECSDCDRG